MAVADFTGDGHLDLMASLNNGNPELVLLPGRGGAERFGPPKTLPAGGPPRQITAGDLNGDGKPDLIVVLDGFGEPLGRFAILLNNGSGNFLPPSIVSLQGNPFRAVLGDLNNDGNLDIVAGLSTGARDGQIAVLLGNGSGGFTPSASSPLTTLSVNSTEVVIGDFNEDGKRDLAIPGQSFATVEILLGDGAGGFAAGVSTSTGTSSTFLTAGDFNNDGHLDLLNGNRMMLGTGTATLAAPIIVPLPENSGAAIAGDVNHDGKLDVVVTALYGLTIGLGNGTGNLVRGASYVSGFSGLARLGDFNEDGKVDLAAVHRSGFAILDGDGAGAFNDALSYPSTLTSPRALVAADFNNDGKQDFAAISPHLGVFPVAAGVEVALGDGAGNFTQKTFSNFGTFPLAAIATADFNSDGKFDIAVTRPSDGRVYFLLNDGTGGFPTDTLSLPIIFVGFQVSTIKAADFNNDTKSDLFVITPQSNSFSVLLGNGSGGFTIVAGGSLQGFSSFADDVDFGDFNADGNTDIAVVRSGVNIVNVLQGDGIGNFTSYASAPTPGTPIFVVVKDFNGDGKPDIAATSSAFENSTTQPYVTVLLNDGALGFSPGTNYPTHSAGMLASGDFNNDSKADLAIASGAALISGSVDGIDVLTNKGNGQFNPAVAVYAGSQSSHLAVRDFNNDNKDDILISQPNGQSVALLLNHFTAAQPCLSVNDVTVTETDAGTIDATFTVTLSAPSAQIVKINYFALSTGSTTLGATKGVDFEDIPGTLTFAPGETTKTFNVPVKGDLIDEFDQSFFVTLSTPINASISDGKAPERSSTTMRHQLSR